MLRSEFSRKEINFLVNAGLGGTEHAIADTLNSSRTFFFRNPFHKQRSKDSSSLSLDIGSFHSPSALY